MFFSVNTVDFVHFKCTYDLNPVLKKKKKKMYSKYLISIGNTDNPISGVAIQDLEG